MIASRRSIAITLVVLVGLGAVAGGLTLYRHRAAHQHADEYFCPMHPRIVRDKPGECPVCGMKLEKREAGRRVLFYRHPMDPSIHSDRPAKDDMGMAYIPVYEDEEQGGSSVPDRAAVTVPPERAASLGIRTEPVTGGFQGGSLRTVGRVAIDERRRDVVHVKYEGYVERLFVDFTGQRVGKGQPLLALYSPELVAAQQEYLVARAAQARLGGSSIPGVAQGGAELAEASRQRLRSFDVTPDEIAELERTGTPRRTLTLRSPVSGVVVQKMAVAGARVSPQDALYEIADLSHVWVLAEVAEKDMTAAGVGVRARVSLPPPAGGEWWGKVTFVSPVVKPETRTVELRVEVDNPSGVLKPEMFTDVSLERAPASVLAVPESAIVQTGERTLVFVDKGQGRYEPREIAIGARVAGGYEVRHGLSAGERVVVSANFLLDSESSLRAAIARTAGEH